MGFWSSLGNKTATGLKAVSGTVYELADAATLGALPNTIQGVQISSIGAKNNIAANAAATLPVVGGHVGQTVPALTSGLPQAGQHVGQTVQYSLQGAGAGVGSVLGDLGAGLKDATADLGKGLGKGLLPIVLLVAFLLIIVALATRGRSVQAGSGGVNLQ